MSDINKSLEKLKAQSQKLGRQKVTAPASPVSQPTTPDPSAGANKGILDELINQAVAKNAPQTSNRYTQEANAAQPAPVLQQPDADTVKKNAYDTLDYIDELKTEQNTGDLEKDRQVQAQIAEAEKQYEAYAKQYEEMTGHKLRSGFWPRVAGIAEGAAKQWGASHLAGVGTLAGTNNFANESMDFEYNKAVSYRDSLVMELEDIDSGAVKATPGYRENIQAQLDYYNNTLLPSLQDGVAARESLTENSLAEAKKISEAAAMDIELAKGNLGVAGQIAADVGVQGVQMLLDAATQGGMVSLASRSYGGAIMDATEDGADIDSAMTYATSIAAREIALEALLGAGLSKIYGGSVVDDAADIFARKLASTAEGQAAVRLAVNTGSNFMEEYLAAASDPAMRTIYSGKSLNEEYSAEDIADWLYEGFIGGLTGFLFSAGNSDTYRVDAADTATAKTGAETQSADSGGINTPPGTQNAAVGETERLNPQAVSAVPNAVSESGVDGLNSPGERAIMEAPKSGADILMEIYGSGGQINAETATGLVRGIPAAQGTEPGGALRLDAAGNEGSVRQPGIFQGSNEQSPSEIDGRGFNPDEGRSNAEGTGKAGPLARLIDRLSTPRGTDILENGRKGISAKDAGIEGIIFEDGTHVLTQFNRGDEIMTDYAEREGGLHVTLLTKAFRTKAGGPLWAGLATKNGLLIDINFEGSGRLFGHEVLHAKFGGGRSTEVRHQIVNDCAAKLYNYAQQNGYLEPLQWLYEDRLSVYYNDYYQTEFVKLTEQGVPMEQAAAQADQMTKTRVWEETIVPLASGQLIGTNMPGSYELTEAAQSIMTEAGVVNAGFFVDYAETLRRAEDAWKNNERGESGRSLFRNRARPTGGNFSGDGAGMSEGPFDFLLDTAPRYGEDPFADLDSTPPAPAETPLDIALSIREGAGQTAESFNAEAENADVPPAEMEETPTPPTESPLAPVQNAPAGTSQPGNTVPPGYKESGFSKNIRSDANMEENIRKDFEANKQIYQQLGNKTVIEAAQNVYRQGLYTARRTVDEAIANAKAGGKIRPETVVLAKMVANELGRQGDVPAARQILSDIGAELTLAGQATNAAKILRDPMSALTSIEKVLHGINAAGRNVRKGTVVVAKDRGNYGKIIGKRDGKYLVQFTSETGATQTLEMSRGEFFIADSKGRGKNGVESPKGESQRGNIYVTGWADEISRNLAERLTKQRGAGQTPTYSKQLERDVAGIIRKTAGKGAFAEGPKPAKDTETTVEKLARVVDNEAFYDSALEQTRQLLADKYNIPRAELDTVLGDWVNYSIRDITTKKINDALSKAYGEAGKDYVARLTPEEEALIFSTDFSKEGEFERVAEQIMTRIGREMPVTLLEQWAQLRKMGMLGNLKTLIKNPAGNVPMAAVRKVANLISGSIQDAEVLLKLMDPEEQTRTARVSRESRALANEFWKANSEALMSDTAGAKTTGEIGSLAKYKTYFNKGLLGAIQRLPNIIPGVHVEGMVLDEVRESIYALMEMGDAPFFKSAFTDSLAQYAQAHGITDIDALPTEAIERAASDAAAYTFRSSNALAKLINAAKRKGGLAGTAADVLFPFTSTPLNMMVQYAEHSPLALFKVAAQVATHAEKADIIDTVARGLTGTGVIVLGILLRDLGWITGAPDDDEDKAAWDKDTGKSPYSIGGKVSYDWAAPVGSLLAMGAAISDARKEDAAFHEKVVDAITAAGDVFMEQDFLQNIRNIFGGYGSPTENLLESVTEGAISQSVPSWFRAITRVEDPTVRSTYTGGGWLEDAKAGVAAGLPWASDKLPASVDIHGEERDRGTKLERWLDNFIIPATINRNEAKEGDEFLASLYEQTGDKTIFPHKAPYDAVIEGQAISLNGAEQGKYQQTSSEVYYDVLGDWIENGTLDGLSPEHQTYALNLLNEFATDAAKRELAEDKGIEYSSDWDDEALLNDPAAYLAVRAVTNLATKDKDNIDVAALDAALDIYQSLDVPAQELLEGSTSGYYGRLGDMEMFRHTGRDTEDWLEAYDKYRELNSNPDIGPQTRAERFAAWVDQQGYTFLQSALLKQQFKFSSGFTVQTGAYDAITKAGVSPDDTLQILDDMDALPTLEGHSNVIQAQKIEAVSDADYLSESEKWAIIGQFVSDAAENSAEAKRAAGWSFDEWADWYTSK